jgi:hypothetical protein
VRLPLFYELEENSIRRIIESIITGINKE